MRSALRAAALFFVVFACIGAAPAFDPAPWLEDFAQVRAAMTAKYANLDWAVTNRGADLGGWYDEARHSIAVARNESDARAAIERFGRRIGDGHIAFLWKSGAPQSGEARPVTCGGLGYNAAINGAPLAANAHGYRALETPQSAEFPIGFLDADKRKVGVLRIGIFEPQGFPPLCEAALTALAIPRDKPCDDACATRISRWAHNRMTEDLAAQLRALKAAGMQVLLIDIANNGGGSEWAEAAARMVTATHLHSEVVTYVRSPGWVKAWQEQENDLRRFAAEAPPGMDKALLLSFALQAHSFALNAGYPCNGEPAWRGERPNCAWGLPGFYATGFLDAADPGTLRGKPYAEMLFSPMQYPYEQGVWHGPLIVLVDRNSYSAAEEFAAVLQDNHAAVILGEPTGGAGCGHMLLGEEVTLKNSGAIFQMPDCARLRADYSNEIQGIQPDVLVGFTPRDSIKLKAIRFFAKLGEAVALAR